MTEVLAGVLAPLPQLALLLLLGIASVEVQRWIDRHETRGPREPFLTLLYAASLMAMLVSLAAVVVWAVMLSPLAALTGFLLRYGAMWLYRWTLPAGAGAVSALPGIAGFWFSWLLSFWLVVSLVQLAG